MNRLVPAAEFNAGKGKLNKMKMKKLVLKGEEPGMLAYSGITPVRWCAFGKRENYKRLRASRTLKPVDDQEVYSIVCFYIRKEYRNKGLFGLLMNEVIKAVKKKKGKIVEAYPVITYSEKIPAVFAWTGFYIAFEKAGLKEVAKRAKSRPVMRYYL